MDYLKATTEKAKYKFFCLTASPGERADWLQGFIQKKYSRDDVAGFERKDGKLLVILNLNESALSCQTLEELEVLGEKIKVFDPEIIEYEIREREVLTIGRKYIVPLRQRFKNFIGLS